MVFSSFVDCFLMAAGRTALLFMNRTTLGRVWRPSNCTKAAQAKERTFKLKVQYKGTAISINTFTLFALCKSPFRSKTVTRSDSLSSAIGQSRFGPKGNHKHFEFENLRSQLLIYSIEHNIYINAITICMD